MILVDPERLTAAIPTTGWSQPSSFRVTGVHHGYSTTRHVDGLTWVLDGFAPVASATVTHLNPGGFLASHIDAAKPPGYLERWIVTIEPAGWLELDGERFHPEPGLPFAMRHWAPHAVVNPTSRPRVALLIDRDVVAHPPGEFQRFALTPEIDSLAGGIQ